MVACHLRIGYCPLNGDQQFEIVDSIESLDDDVM